MPGVVLAMDRAVDAAGALLVARAGPTKKVVDRTAVRLVKARAVERQVASKVMVVADSCMF